MEVRIPAAVVEVIRAHAADAAPEECAGFLVGHLEGGDRVVTESRRARNAQPGMREVRYTIDPRDTLAVERDLREAPDRVLGFYHSHPRGPPEPSALDRQRAWPWYVYVILAPAEAERFGLTAWSLRGETDPFEGVSVRTV